MAKKFVRENVPLSRFGVLVAQLESIVASASQQSPDSLLCFDLLSDLISSIDEEPKESILLWQRKCEDALYALLILGALRPVRHLASLAMARIISKGDPISIYSRASSLQGYLSDGKRSEPLRAAGAAQCLGELYRRFGRRITSGLLETTNIAAKLMKFQEVFVRQEALEMLQNALEGSGGSGASAAYAEAFRLIMRVGVGDKSFIIRLAAARCLKTFASIGGPGLGVSELENSSTYCVKALDDPVSSVRDAFAEALGALLALGMNPDAQVQPRGKSHPVPARKLEGCLQKFLTGPFLKANGMRSKEVRIGLTLSWVFFLQAIRLRYHHPDSELPDFALQAMNMLHGHSTVDSHALACVLYILRVGITDQMSETTQTSFLVLLGKQLESPDLSPPMKVAALRTLSYILTTLGEVPLAFKDVLDNTIVAALSHPERLVRIEAALTLRALAEVDPTCVGGLISYAVTTLNALRESISFDKGNSMQVELDSLHGQATVLAALVAISPKLPLGYPARLPQSVLDVAKKLLNECSRNAIASLVEKEAGWLLLASLINSIPKEELEDQVFDILSLWASLFGGSSDYQMKEGEDLSSEIRVWSAAVDALTAFVKCFISPNMVDLKNGILLQPVLVYLGRALSHISLLAKKQLSDIKPAMDLFIIRTLIAYRSLSDPVTYKSDHPQLIQICTSPFRDPSGYEESSCLRLLLDKRDAWLGPWIPGRDWFEDELRAFQGGKDGLMPCVWENELSTFPQPETTTKMLVNQMLLCFGILFAVQDSGGMLSLLGMLEQCLKTGKKQSWHPASVTNACVGLLSGLKALLALRPQPLGLEILSSAQAIFQGILSEGDISAAQRRASSEGLGLLARLGNDIFTARMTRSLLGDLVGATDSSYTGSIALSLGCIHRSAGGMALSTLVPATVNSISLLAKSHNASLQIWSLHGLLLTIEAAGLSFVSQVQATLLLSMEILLSEENGWVDLRQGIGRLINAIVAVLGPELSPGSIFFSRCKSVVAEISSGQETSTLHESVRFTQQLVLFAPQAVSMHAHVRTLLPTLTSRQPTLRHLAVSTLRHLIEKDPVSIIAEQIEENLFYMLDEETDPEIGNLVRATITRLLYTSCSSCSSHWISICQNMILATSSRRNTKSEHNPPSGSDGDARSYFGEDDENMVDSAQDRKKQVSAADVLGIDRKRESHLRYRTRVFAAECLSHVPVAVGNNPAHFDLSLARKLLAKGQPNGDWLVLRIQELIAIAYQISTIQFENMQPLGVKLLCTIMDKFEKMPDPELPGHFLMEQYQAQLVSAVRTSLDTTSSPLLLEAGLHLATKILTSSIISGDQAAIKRIFSLISRPLNDFKELYYPSFAEWVACKIKVRLLAAHASVKAYVYAFLRRRHKKVADEYIPLIPQFSQSSSVLGKYWIWILKDYCYTRFCLHYNGDYNTFLEGIQSPLVTSKLQQCLEEAWPVILQATALDAVPAEHRKNVSSAAVDEAESKNNLISGHRMVELESGEFQFLWGFSLLILFQGQSSVIATEIIGPKVKSIDGSVLEGSYRLNSRCDEIAFMVFQSLSTESFFGSGFLTSDICKELLQVFAHAIQVEHSWTNLVIPVLSQIVQVCPGEFYETEGFASLAMEICITYLYKLCQSSHDHPHHADLVSALFATLKTLLDRYRPQVQTATLLASLLTSYTCLRGASTESCISKATSFVQSTEPSLKKYVDEKAKCEDDGMYHLRIVFGALQNVIATMIQDFHKNMHLLENKKTDLSEQLKMKLLFCLEHAFSVAKVFHENQHLQASKDDNQFLYQVYRSCTKCFKMTLSDSEMQVQTVGINALKSLVQREVVENSHVENHSFIMFFIGELFGDLFQIVYKMIKKPVSKDAVAITGECLRLLVLIQTLSKVAECQKGIIKLLLEIIVMVVSESVDDHSKESNEIRATAVRLVSHLAQIPSSAAHFKDVLLAMPVIRREKLQDIIRASVTVDNSTLIKPTASPLIIKIPMPNEQSKKNDSQVDTPVSSKMHPDEGSLDEEEEDWDAFQSFPATANAPITNSEVEGIAVELNPVENVSILVCDLDNDDGFQKFSSSQTLEDVKDVSDAQHLEGSGDKMILSQSIQNDFAGKDPSASEGVSKPSVIDGDKFEEIVRNEDNGCQDGEKLNCENFVDDAQKESMRSEGVENNLASSDSLEVGHESGVNEPTENNVGYMLNDMDNSNDTGDFSEVRPLEHADLGTNNESGQDASEPQHIKVDVGSHHGHKDASETHCTGDGDEVTHNDHDPITTEQVGDKPITEKDDDQQQDNTINREA
ncbi:hypothetical protein AQUCO_00201132v1 [Aquilegia coerulea]|uniref:Protein SWEETIE n=1 Tax=Aquilegia coerulea TaxID=218851 RepID=A0A2G5F6M5_AQUCA|nr:hypothetical protein AQUCO_00201132v1 [Aquilegia coerulea]